MALQDALQQFGQIEGYLGSAVFSPTGEPLATHIAGGNLNMAQIGVLANNALLNAQKASLEMGAGRGQMLHIVGESAHILARCVNEGKDPVKSEPGKAHYHTILVLANDNAIGMAKMRLNQISESLAAELRV